jgi:hypothetical protein
VTAVAVQVRGPECGQLTEGVRRPSDGEQTLPPVPGTVPELDLPGDDDEQLIAQLSLGEEDMAARGLDRSQVID